MIILQYFSFLQKSVTVESNENIAKSISLVGIIIQTSYVKFFKNSTIVAVKMSIDKFITKVTSQDEVLFHF